MISIQSFYKENGRIGISDPLPFSNIINKFNFFIAIYLLLSFRFTTSTTTKIKIFTESQCKDTIKFLQTSLKDALIAMDDIDKFIDLEFIPYGNGQQFKGTFNFWQFECQHGPVECYGNLMEACALDILIGLKKQANFLVCLHEEKKTTKEEYDYDAQKCLSSRPCNYQKIKYCMDSIEGNYLLHRAGIMTKANNVYYVPWITSNGQHDIQTEFDIKDNFLEWFCMTVLKNEKPEYCLNLEGK